MKRNAITEKAEDLAVRIVRLYRYLVSKGETDMSKQLLKAGTSIGANNSEAQYAQSRAEFKAKMNIALKEANETLYWLRILFLSDYLTKEEFCSIDAEASEVKGLLIAIIKSTNEHE